ncbi:MAG: CoA pyrophosphatase [Candidatus Sumerlaeia bacterium]|nr:CoA pyrophosphatase [Candidatus Sumerlaeia bacterium]
MNELQLAKLKRELRRKPGIQGTEDYFNTSVLVLLLLKNKEYHFVLEKRHPKIRQGDEICFPGGKFDPQKDRNLIETALRETREELGIPETEIKIIGRLDTFIAPLGAIIEPFVGITRINNLEQFQPNPEEVKCVFSLPVSFFERSQPEEYEIIIRSHPSYITKDGKKIDLLPVKQLGLPSRYARPWGEHRRKILIYQTEYGPIWGITAKIINDIVRKLTA